MTFGKYMSDFYILPTIFVHRNEGIYTSIEIAWLKWYMAIIK